MFPSTVKFLVAFSAAISLLVHPSEAKQTEILEKSATVTLTPDLEIYASSPVLSAIWVKRVPQAGTLTLQKGRGIEIKKDYQQLLDTYRLTGTAVLSASIQGNTFKIETRTGTASVYVHSFLKQTYVPQAPGELPVVYSAVAHLSSLTLRTHGQSLRKAFESFRPKSASFRDSEKPSLFVTDPPRAATTSSKSYTIRGLSYDNVAPQVLESRVRRPGASAFGVWKGVRVRGTAKAKPWTFRLPMHSAKGFWRVEFRMRDAAGNTSKVVRVVIRRK